VGWKSETPRIALRYWLATVAGFAAALALALSAAFAHASTASLLDPGVIVWGYGADGRFHDPLGIAIDPADGTIYVANTGDHTVEAFSRTGRPLARFVHRVTGPSGAVVDGDPAGVAVDRAGRVLVADNAAPYVDVLDLRGRSIARLDIPEGHASALAVAHDGTIFVGTSAGASRVHVFRPDYTPVGVWGEAGADSGRLKDVTAIAVLPDGNLLVACARTRTVIQVFTPGGAYVRGFGLHENGPGNFSLPSGVAATPDGRIWVCDQIRQTIQVFDREGTYIGATGGSGLAPGQFQYPSALASDGRNSIAVAERESARFQILKIAQTEEVTAGGEK